MTIGRLDLPPNVGAHTVFPVLRVEIPEFGRQTESALRDFLVITNESTANECREARQMVWVADITAEAKPFGVSNWTVPEASGNFCGRGGRFGTHSSNENFSLIYYGRGSDTWVKLKRLTVAKVLGELKAAAPYVRALYVSAPPTPPKQLQYLELGPAIADGLGLTPILVLGNASGFDPDQLKPLIDRIVARPS